MFYCYAIVLFCCDTNAKLREANCFSVDGDIETTRGRLLHPVVVLVILILTSMLTTTDLSTI